MTAKLIGLGNMYREFQLWPMYENERPVTPLFRGSDKAFLKARVFSVS